MIAVKMVTLTIPDKITRKTKSASTLPAVVEARAGQSGKVSNIDKIQSSGFSRQASVVSRQSSAYRLLVVSRTKTDQHDHERSQPQDGRQRRQLQHPGDNRSVFPRCRIVVIAVQQHLV